MKILKQVNLSHYLLFIFTLKISASLFIDHKTSIYPTINSSFLHKNDRLLRPIIVPNLTFPFSDLSLSKGENLSDNLNNLNKFKNSIEKNVFSENFLKTFKDGVKLKEISIPKFSSRYSSGLGKKNKYSKITENEQKNKNKIISNKTQDFSLTENEYSNLNLPKNTNAPLFISHSTSKKIEVAKPFNEDVNEAKEKEKAAPSIVSFTPQKITSFSNELQKNHFSDDENEDGEAFLDRENDDEGELEEAEDDIENNFFHDFDEKFKNYNSVQTPLKEIKYRGSGFESQYNDFDYDFDYNFDWKKPRTRLLKPMESSFRWPFSKKKETESKTSKIEDFSKNFKNSTISSENKKGVLVSKTSEKLQKIKKFNDIEKNNTSRGRSRGNKRFNIAFGTEKTENEKEANPSANNQIKQSRNEFNSTNKLFSSEGGHNQPLRKQKTNLIRPTFNNRTWEIKNGLEARKIKSNLYDDSLKKKTLTKKKEWQHDNRKPTQQNSVKPGDPAKSFDHLEESDEMYNQILSNIQSVFGIRIEPLKSSTVSRINIKHRN